MITNKSAAIRRGYSINWPLSFSTSSPISNITYTSLQHFFDSFFSDSTFRDRGFISSHSLIRSSLSRVQVYSFMQDAKFADFFNTFPRRSVFTSTRSSRSAYGKYGINRLRNNAVSSEAAMKNKFSFSKKNLFFIMRNYRFSAKFPWDFANRHLLSKYHIAFSRVKRSKRYSRFNQTFFINFFNFTAANNFFRARYYFFITRLLSYFFFLSFGVPLRVYFNYILTRQATATFYLNYICTRLYYRYILNDVVNPLVRMSLRHYRGFAINCKGRFTRAQMASQKNYRRGSMAFGRITNELDYAQKSVVLKYGVCNLKVWIRR